MQGQPTRPGHHPLPMPHMRPEPFTPRGHAGGTGFNLIAWVRKMLGIVPGEASPENQLADRRWTQGLVAGLQPLLTFDPTPTEGSPNPVTSGGVWAAVDALSGLVPSQASASNQLADKAFVNSSIATSTATFRGTFNLVTDLQLPLDATHVQVAAAVKVRLGQSDYDGSDYVFVQVPQDLAHTDAMKQVDCYKCVETGADPVVKSWEYEWTLNNSSFTEAQWAAINSGITSGAVAKLGALPTAEALAQELAGKASKSDATLTPIYGGNGEKYSAWSFSDGNAHTVQGPFESEGDGFWFYMLDNSWSQDGYFDTEAEALTATSIPFIIDDAPDIIATRTENVVIGYRLGSQTDKSLAALSGLVFEGGSGAHSAQQRGTGVVASGDNSVAIGADNISGASTPEQGDELHYASAEGYASYAEGAARAVGDYSHAEGGGNAVLTGDWTGHPTIPTASGKYSHAEGTHTWAKGSNSHAEGDTTLAEGAHSHAEGRENKSIGGYSHTEGRKNVAYGDLSHVEGWNNTGRGEGSHVEGKSNEINGTGDSNHIEGKSNKITTVGGRNPYSAHVEGNENEAQGAISHAEGYKTVVKGEASHTEGSWTRTSNNFEHAQGRLNASHTSNNSYPHANNTIHSVGIGTSDSVRRNAVETMQDGKTFVLGIGGYDGTNPTGQPNAAQDLATVVNAKASKSDATLTPIYSEPPTFSVWTFSDVSDGITDIQQPVFRLHSGGESSWQVSFGYEGQTLTAAIYSDYENATNLTFEYADEGLNLHLTATRTRTDIIGYRLGPDEQTNPNRDKPLQPAEHLLLAQYYPDGNVKSAAEFTSGIKYNAPDTANRTITVKPFCNTGTAADDNSNLSGRVVIPPFVDAQSNGYISDNGTRFKVVGVSGGTRDDTNENLTAIVAPTTVTTIGDDAFSYCTSLTSVSLPAATNIGASAFFHCTLLASVSLPAAQNIGNMAFFCCTSLTAVSLPAAQSIGDSAFEGCSSLSSVSLPAATAIGDDAFINCTLLTSVDFGGTPRSSVPSLGSNAFYNVPTACTIVVPYMQYDAWKAANGWSALPQEFVRHPEKADKPATFTAGNLAALDAQGNPTDSLIPAANVAVKSNIPYDLVTKTIANGEVTLDDRAANAVTISATLSPNTLTVNFPTATTTGKVRDFALRLDLTSGVTAPEITWPQGVTLENDGGEVPEIADGGTGGSSTILYFSETATNKFLVKGETLTAIAQV